LQYFAVYLFIVTYRVVFLYIFLVGNSESNNQECVEAVYVYAINCGSASNGYSQALFPVASDAVPDVADMTFGYSVSVNGNFMTVGAPTASKPSTSVIFPDMQSV
jgi:hypothetical protein